tara:strand:+ start:1207 stop:1659 length:453 start_codon:yes stop_codon:yes gene_type:complete
MATTVNNTNVNSRLTIVFDAAGQLDGDGPAKGTGNTQSDVYIDDKTHQNLRSHTEVDASVHALQWNASTNTGEIEYTDSRANDSISSIPQWATNVVIRCEAEDTWQSTYDSTYAGHSDAGAEDDSAAITAAKTAADTARTDYLTANSITY